MPPRKPKSLTKLLWMVFAAFIVYGTAIPFRFRLDAEHLRQRVADIIWFPFSAPAGISYQPADWLQNLLLFIPFGFLGYAAIADKQARWKPYAVTALGFTLSAAVEFLQLFTETRFTSLSDLILNTTGTALGIWIAIGLRGELLRLNSRPLLRRLLDAEPAFPTLIFTFIAAAGAWMPFDFALSGATLRAKIHYFPSTFHSVEFASGDLLTLTHFVCLALFACRLFREAGLPGGKVSGALAGGCLGMAMETGQFFVRSQCPDFKGALVISVGMFLGFAFSFLPSFRDRPKSWGVLISGWFAAAIAVGNLYPFRFTGFSGGINWIPFLPQTQNLSFTTLSGFLQEAAAYSSVGVIWAYLLSASGTGKNPGLRISMGFALVSGLGMEALRRGLPEGKADVTWLLGALSGTLAGWLLVARGWRAYREYVGFKTPDNSLDAAADSNRYFP